jgi:tRNA threonylcarbamoyladenosine biosynthesis protein TsaB
MPSAVNELPSPLLVLDTVSPTAWAGLLVDGRAACWRPVKGEAGSALFSAVESTLQEARITVADLAGFAFNEGPGSLLGIRIAAMAIEGWQALGPGPRRPLFSFRSLELLARLELANGRSGPFRLIADARRDSWHFLAVAGEGSLGEIARLPAAEGLPEEGPILRPAGFPVWSRLPEGCSETAYDPSLLPDGEWPALLRPAQQADAWLIDPPEYRKWEPAPPPPPPPPPTKRFFR